MIVYEPLIEFVGFQLAHYPSTDIVAVALCSLDGVQVEPFVVTAEGDGLLAIRTGVILEPDGQPEIDLRAVFGGVSVDSLTDAANSRLVQCVHDRTRSALLAAEAKPVRAEDRK